jgi:hypothetical protein
VEHDWALLQKALHVSTDDEVATRSARPMQAGSQLRWGHAGNRP